MDDFEDIIGYEGLYKINRNGDVWSYSRKRLLKPSIGKDGYCSICLCNYKQKRCYLHRLIGIQFIPNPYNLPEIDHIDLNKNNNNIDNLRWVSKSTNQQNKNKSKNNKTGFKNISTFINKCKNEYWIIRINIHNIQLSYPKKKYTLEEVVEFRNKIYIDNNIQRYD
jgi:hypothetical protein